MRKGKTSPEETDARRKEVKERKVGGKERERENWRKERRKE